MGMRQAVTTPAPPRIVSFYLTYCGNKLPACKKSAELHQNLVVIMQDILHIYTYFNEDRNNLFINAKNAMKPRLKIKSMILG